MRLRGKGVLFLIASVGAQSCLEECLFANEIAPIHIWLNSLRLVCSPFTYTCGCDSSPEAIAAELGLSIAHFFCCNPNLTPVCFWRTFAQATFICGLDRWEDCGLPRECYDAVYVGVCCIPIASCMALSIPASVGYCGLFCCTACVESFCPTECISNGVNYCSERCRSLCTRRPRSNEHIRYSIIYQQEPPIPPVTIRRESLQPEPEQHNKLPSIRSEQKSLWVQILDEPLLFFVGLLFIIFNYYFLENLESIRRRVQK